MAEDDQPKITIIQPGPEGFRRSNNYDGLLWTAHESLRGEMADHAHELADHGGQLKTIPALAAAIQQNFGIWFAAIASVAGLIFAGFAFLGTYQVSNSQALSEHSVQLTAQASAASRIEQDVREVRTTLEKVSQNVDALAADRREKITP